LKELYIDHGRAETVETPQRFYDQFRWYYNHESSHRFLNQEDRTAGRETTPNPA
jgi:hypothetical protein